MKKLFSLFAAFLFVGSMWATIANPYSFTFASGDLTTSSTSFTKGEVTWSLSDTENQYSGTANKTGYLFGSAGSPKNLTVSTSGISGTITNISVTGRSNNKNQTATVSVKVGSSNFTSADDTWDNGNNQTLTFTGSASGTIEVTITPDACGFILNGISVSYSTAPTLSINPTSWAFGNVKDQASASKEFTLTAGNLTKSNSLTIAVTGGYTVSPTSINVDANGALATNTVTVYKNKTTAGSNAGTLKVYGAGIEEASAATASLSMTVQETYAVNVAVAVTDRSGDPIVGAQGNTATVNGGSVAYVVDENEELSLVAQANGGYHFTGWTYDGNKLLVTDDDDASTTAYAYEAVTVTANFQEDDCDALDAPTLNGAIATTYNSASIKWNSVANADGYILNVVNHEDATDKPADAETMAGVNNTTKNLSGLTVNTTYDYTIQTKGDGSTYCAVGKILVGSFTTTDYPEATLTLSENGATHNLAGDHFVADVVTLPSDLDNDSNKVDGKVFVGWDANASCTSKPTYAPGAEYTLAAETQTLYAVYGEITGDEEPVLTQTLEYDTWTYSGTTTNMSSDNYRLFAKDAYVESANLDLSILVKVNVYAGTYGSISPTSGKKVTINAIKGETTTQWATCALSTNKATTKNEATSEVELTGTGKLRVVAGGGDGSSTGIRLSRVEIFTQEPLDTTGYSTTGKKAATVTVDPTQLTLNATATSNVVTVTTVNVDDENLSVALFNDAECTEAFDGGWLTASINGDKNIAYSALAPISYANKRTAYIQLTAPAEDDGVADVVVVIKATQNQKPANFSSFEALQASDLPRTEDGTSSVKVTFSDVAIHSISSGNVYLDIKDTDDDTKYIQIYNGSANAPSTWHATGSVSGSQLTGKWKLYDGAMEFVISDWSKVDYTAPSFASFEDLVAADLGDGKLATVSFSNVKITDFEEGSGGNVGIYLNVKDKTGAKDIQLYCGTDDVYVDNSWQVNGYVSGTDISGTWRYYSSDWYLSIANWDGIDYSNTPTALEDVETSVKAVKVLRNGVLYIEKSGRVYNAQGQLVK